MVYKKTSSDNLPTAYRAAKDSSESSLAPLWIRIEAFLSLKSPNTQKTYLGVLGEWCNFLGATMGSSRAASLLAGATDLHAAAYRKYLERRPGEVPREKRRRARIESHKAQKKELSTSRADKQTASGKKEGLETSQSNATIAKKFAALRRLYKVLMAHGMAGGHNPFDTDRTPPPPKDSGRKRPTEMVDFSMVEAILELPDTKTIKGRRDKGILAALFGGALRRSEVINLRLCDLKKTPAGTPYLYLRSTKAKRDAQQAIPKWAAESLEAVRRDRLEMKAHETDYLFVGFSGKGGLTPSRSPISPVGLYELFRAYADKAGVSAYITPHSARATAITKLLADGIPHRQVQEFSRHASIQMVELYDKRRVGVDENPGAELTFGVEKK